MISTKQTNGMIAYLTLNFITIASYLLMTPPQEKITHKDRLMYNLPLGKNGKEAIGASVLLNAILSISLSLDNVFGFVLSSVVSFLGGSIAFDNECSASEHSTSHFDVIVAAKPTIFARYIMQALWIDC